MSMNRLANTGNRYQGTYKKVLCLCSAGLLRSPTAALVLSQDPFNFNTRAAGLSEEYALIYADDVLLRWADEIVTMEMGQKNYVISRLEKLGLKTPVISLGIPDEFYYRDPKLIELIKLEYEAQKESE